MAIEWIFMVSDEGFDLCGRVKEHQVPLHLQEPLPYVCEY